MKRKLEGLRIQRGERGKDEELQGWNQVASGVLFGHYELSPFLSVFAVPNDEHDCSGITSLSCTRRPIPDAFATSPGRHSRPSDYSLIFASNTACSNTASTVTVLITIFNL